MLQRLRNKIVPASFNSTMDPLTINETTFNVMQGVTANTVYTPTITTATKNIYPGNTGAFTSVSINHHY